MDQEDKLLKNNDSIAPSNNGKKEKRSNEKALKIALSVVSLIAIGACVFIAYDKITEQSINFSTTKTQDGSKTVESIDSEKENTKNEEIKSPSRNYGFLTYFSTGNQTIEYFFISKEGDVYYSSDDTTGASGAFRIEFDSTLQAERVESLTIPLSEAGKDFEYTGIEEGAGFDLSGWYKLGAFKDIVALSEVEAYTQGGYGRHNIAFIKSDGTVKVMTIPYSGGKAKLVSNENFDKLTNVSHFSPVDGGSFAATLIHYRDGSYSTLDWEF